MANIKSQIKRIRTAEVRRVANKGVRSELKTYAKRFDEAIGSGDLETAEQARRAAAKKFDEAASAGVIHANKAANHKSGMTAKLARAIAAPPVVAEAKRPAKKAAAKKTPATKKPAAAKASPIKPAAKKPAAKAPAAKSAKEPKAAAKTAAKTAAKKPAKKAASED